MCEAMSQRGQESECRPFYVLLSERQGRFIREKNWEREMERNLQISSCSFLLFSSLLVSLMLNNTPSYGMELKYQCCKLRDEGGHPGLRRKSAR